MLYLREENISGIFGRKKEEKQDAGKITEEPHNLYFSPYGIKVIKPKAM
jgi:hypothetical protein